MHRAADLASRAAVSRLLILALAVAAAAGCAGTTTGVVQARPLVSLELPGVPVRPEVVVAPAAPPPAALPFRILPRTDWALSGPIRARLVPMGTITRITIHHAGMEAAEETSAARVKEELRKIQKSHEDRMHAGDIGYHYVIDYNGRIWNGRDMSFQGAHAGNNDANKGNIGVMLLGNFDVQQPTDQQLRSLRTLVDHLMARYSVAPANVYTHREVRKLHGLSATECPGHNLQTRVNSMRRSIAEARVR